MVSFFKLLLGFTSYFLTSRCSDLQIKNYSEGFEYKDDRLIVDGHNLDPDLLFSQLSSIKFLNELTIREFVFDEISVKELSKAISALSIKKLSIIQCDFNEEIATLFIIPPSVKSIHLEELNLSSKGIEIVLNKLDPSVESITISGCYNNEPKKQLQNFSKFCFLKQIYIDEESICRSKINRSLRSTIPTSLESIKLHGFALYADDISSTFERWIHKYGKSFTDNIKVIEFNSFYHDSVSNSKLIRQLLYFDNLENLSCGCYGGNIDFSIEALPPKLKQLDLVGAEIDIKINQEQIFNQNILSALHLTHLTVDKSFDEFPIDLFHLKNLEYLNLKSVSCKNNFILTVFQFPSSLKHVIIKYEHLSPFMPNFGKYFKVIERLEVEFEGIHETFNDLEKLFTSSTLKGLKLDFHMNDSIKYKFNTKYECLLEELELRSVSWEFISHLIDKLIFPRLRKITFGYIEELLDLYAVLHKLQMLTELTSLSFEEDARWLFGNELPFIFKHLISFSWEFHDIDVIELDHLMRGMPKLQSLQFPTWNNNVLLLQQPAINIRYIYLPVSVSESKKTVWINFLKNLPNLVQLRKSVDYDLVVENEITAGDLAYYLKILKEHFKHEMNFIIQYNCYPILLFKKDSTVLKLVRYKSKELRAYLNEIFPLSVFGLSVKRLFTFEFERYFASVNSYSLAKFFKLMDELEIENEEDVLFLKNILFSGADGRFTDATDFSLPNFYNVFLNYSIERTKVNLNVDHLEFLIQFFKANKQHGFEKINKFIQTFFISISIAVENHKVIDKEMFIFFSKLLLTPSFHLFFDKILNKELSKKEKQFLPMDYESIADDLKKLEPEQYEALSIYFKDFLIEFTNESFIESFSNIFKKILIPETKCAICYESLFLEKCKFSNVGNINCHLYHRFCLDKWLDAKKECPHCRQVIV